MKDASVKLVEVLKSAALNDKNPEVKRKALESLERRASNFDGALALKAIEDISKSTDEELRKAAELSLLRLTGESITKIN